MDKYQEAYDIIFDGLIPMPELNEIDKKCLFDSMDLLQELINKHKPMKVIQKPVKHYIDYYCPCCNRKLSRKTTYYFCPKKDCGQALDWSDR